RPAIPAQRTRHRGVRHAQRTLGQPRLAHGQREMSTVLLSPERAVKISTRVQSIDIIRGAVMILMAIDHVRVYSGVPAGGRTAGIFFTRWVTHFCAPAFAFLAGTAAFLYGRKSGETAALARCSR